MKRTPLKRTTPLKRVSLRRKLPRRAKQWQKARALQIAFYPSCAVPFCRKAVEVVHHVSNKGMGYRDHSPENLQSLCFTHHTGELGVHSLGKKTWMRRFFPDEDE